jgi:hypothetical protein
MIFKKNFAAKLSENNCVLSLKVLLVFLKKMVITFVFEKKTPTFFRRKLAKIAENCDHKIDPWTPKSGS